MSYILLNVTEGDDPLYEVTAVERKADDSIGPVDLTGGAMRSPRFPYLFVGPGHRTYGQTGRFDSTFSETCSMSVGSG